MATDPNPATSPTAPEAENASPPADSLPPAGARSLAWAIPLAGLIPWRAFPVIRRVSTGPIVAVYVACVAASLALTFHGISRAGGMAPPWQGVLLGQAVSLGLQLLSLYVLLTLSGASRRQRLPETLAVGLKLLLAAYASMFLCTATVYVVMQAAGFSPASIGGIAYMIGWPCVRIYMIAAMGIAAARLADRDDRTERHDPLWPRCTRCNYSLRGLPAAEAWLALREGRESTPPASESGPLVCPECGRAIDLSLRTWEAWLTRGARQPHAADIPEGSDDRDTSVPARFFRWLMRWMLGGRRTMAVALWLVTAAAIAVAIMASPFMMPFRPRSGIVLVFFSMWEEVLLLTGGAGLLMGLLFSRRGRPNLVWLSQHVLVPATCISGVILLMLLARYHKLQAGGIVITNLLGLHAMCLPLVPLVAIAEGFVLRRVGRMWSAGR